MRSDKLNGLSKIITACLVVMSMANAWAEPQNPAINRSVDVISDGKFNYPMLPAVSSTEDGRIGISRDQGGMGGLNIGGYIRIMLLRPEAIKSEKGDKNFLQMEATNEPVIVAGPDQHVILDGTTTKVGGIWQTSVDEKILGKAEILEWPVERTGMNAVAKASLTGASGDAYVSSGLMGGGGSMPLLCEENRDQSGVVLSGIEEVRNPYACSVTVDMNQGAGNRFAIDKTGGDHDCYDLAIIMNGSIEMVDENANGTASTTYTKLVSRRVTVAVANPKTAEAKIIAVKDEGFVESSTPLIGGTWLEPNITGDGKLILTRIGTNHYPIPGSSVADCETMAEASAFGNSNQNLNCRAVDVVYSYNPGSRCDVDGFTAYHPMSHGYWDNRLNPAVNRDGNSANDVDAAYGFAAYQLRSPDGYYLADNEDVQGSYGWMDREGNNFMFTIGGTQTYTDANYEFPFVGKTSCVKPDGVTPLTTCSAESFSLGRGPNGGTWSPLIVGSWTRGKMIFQDNLLNNSDYALGINNWEEKLFDIYEGDPVRVSGRYVSLALRKTPAGSVGNTDFFESLENRFNFQEEFKPASFRDVVWKMSSGAATDEFVFDDYISRYSYVVADMVGARLLDDPANEGDNTPGVNARLYAYPDGSGGDNNYLTQVQNGATMEADFKTPRVGNVVNHGSSADKPRIEPVALGGIKGRGLWLNGSFGIDFSPRTENSTLNDSNIYVSLFVDSRATKDHVARQLVRFPDGSSIRVTKMNGCYWQQVCDDAIPFDVVDFYNASGNLVANWDVTKILSSVVARRQEWVHLGFQIDKISASQTKVDIYINGYRFTEWYSSQGLIFKITENGVPINAAITAGASAENNGLVGWIDEFKVVLEAQNPELACNHALGTLIGVDNQSPDEWKSVADSFGGPVVNSSHDKVTTLLKANKSKFYSQYACFHDYRGDHRATRNNIPRKSIAGGYFESYGVHYGLLSVASKPGVTGSSVAMPLYHDEPRHDFSANEFCTGCHSNTEKAKGLKISALVLGGTDAVSDARRQPTQPLDKIRGNIPAGWKIPGAPALSQIRGIVSEIDPMVLSSYASNNQGDADSWSPQYELEISGTDPQSQDTDSDGVLDSADASPLINPNQYAVRDTDSDSTPDYQDNDADGDSIANLVDDCPYTLGSCASVNNPDLDADGIPDATDTDDDGDGVIDGSDNCQRVGNPDQMDKYPGSATGDACELDSDSDFLPDAWEDFYGLNKLNHTDAESDGDGDRMAARDEYFYGTNPTTIDFDGDLLPDGWESAWGLNPRVKQRNSTWTYDLWRGQALIPLQMYLAVKNFPAHHNLVVNTQNDADLDGFWDATAQWHLDGSNHVLPADNCLFVANPDQLDSDEDGLGDACESGYSADSNDWDSDDDGMPDGWEIWWGLNPASAADAGQDLDLDGVTHAVEYTHFKNQVYAFLTSQSQHNYPFCDLGDPALRCDVRGYVRFEFASGRGNPYFKNADEDGLEDDWETANGLNPSDPNDEGIDSDGDGIVNYMEYVQDLNPQSQDTDGDLMFDNVELQYGFNPLVSDAEKDPDSDGMPNLWEIQNGLNPTINERYADLDSDGVQNIYEYLWGTIANNPDTDGDGLTDGDEAYLFSSVYQPQYADTDCGPPPYGTNTCDGINDGNEDYDGDMMSNTWELEYGFDPTNAADGITDADGDMLGNQAEFMWSTDPHDPDTDNDGHSDHKEVVLGSHALNRLDPPLPILTVGTAAGAMLMGGIDDVDFENSPAARDVFWNITDGSLVIDDVIDKQIGDVIVTDADICLLFSMNNVGCLASEWNLESVTRLAGNRTHTCAIQASTALCNPAGDNTYGQSTPTVGLTGVIDLAAGLQHTCALTTTAIDCWGDDTYGQSPDESLASPLAVAAGDKHTCAIISGGVVQCWGDNTQGQLGDGADGDSYVDGVTDARQIVAGSNHSCVITGDYLTAGGPRVKCWGDMTSLQAQVPVSLTDGTDVPLSIRAAGDRTCVIKAESTASTVSTPLVDLMVCWPVEIDSDADDTPDHSDTDDDNDGLPDVQENLLGSTQFNPDTDGDGMADGWENQYGLDLLLDDAGEDLDQEGITNLTEYQWGTRPDLADSDGDGLTDFEEAYSPFASYYQPQHSDTDCVGSGCDSVNDGNEDCDGDAISNLVELRVNFTDPTNGAACIN